MSCSEGTPSPFLAKEDQKVRTKRACPNKGVPLKRESGSLGEISPWLDSSEADVVLVWKNANSQTWPEW